MKRNNSIPFLFFEATKRYNRLKGIRDTERQLRYFEKRMAQEVGEVFIEQGKILLDKLEEHRHYFAEEIGRDIDYAFNIVKYLTFNRFRDVVMRYHIIGSKIAEESVTSSVGMDTSFSQYDVGAYAELERTAAQRVSGIDEVTRARIKEIIMTGYEERKTYSQIAKEIKDEFAEFAAPSPLKHIRNRAELVAVTELRDAHEASQEKMIQHFSDAGYQMEKSWLSTDDESRCEICQGNTEAKWIDASSTFPSGHVRTPAHPGCRCRTVYRVKPGTWAKAPQKVSAGGMI